MSAEFVVNMLWKANDKSQHEAGIHSIFEIGALILPLWVSVLVGLVLGWSWKPRWVGLFVVAMRRSPLHAIWGALFSGFGSRGSRIWLAATALAAFPALKEACLRILVWIGRPVCLMWKEKVNWVLSSNSALTDSRGHEHFESSAVLDAAHGLDEVDGMVNSSDLERFCLKIDGNDSGPSWNLFLSKEAPGLKYTAWRRDPENEPTEYRSRTVLNSCSPDLLRDFFWDDEFRVSAQWDDLILKCNLLEECDVSGQQIVHWIRKFPLFCKDREYVIGRRIWSLNNVYYCVSKGVSHMSAPPRDHPRRVPYFHSSWRIKQNADGSCEVLLFHQEEMGIQRHLAKLGIRQGMWPAVKKMQAGIRQYHHLRLSEPSAISRSASMASFHTPISPSGPPVLNRIWNSLSDLAQADCGVGASMESPRGNNPDRIAASPPPSRGEAELSQGQSRHGWIRGRVGRGLWLVMGGLAVVWSARHPALACKLALAGAAEELARRKFIK